MQRILQAILRITKAIGEKRRALLALSCAVVFVTTYLLILPAMAIDKDAAAKQGGIDLPAAEQTGEGTGAADADPGRTTDSATRELTSSEGDGVIDADGSGANAEVQAGTAPDDTSGKPDGEVNDDITVADEQIKKTVIDAKGDTWEITVTYRPDAGVPKGAALLATELTEEDREYISYAEQAASMIDSDTDELVYFRLLDISIVDQNGDKVTLNAPVDVQIHLLDDAALEGDLQIVHFAEDTVTDTVEPELLESNTEGDYVDFQTDSFSAYAIVQGPDAVVPEGWQKITTVDDLMARGSEGLYIGQIQGYWLRNDTAINTESGSDGATGILKTRTPGVNAVKYYFEPVEGATDQFYLYCLDKDNDKTYVRHEAIDTISTEGNSLYLVPESQKTAFQFIYRNNAWVIKAANTNTQYWNMRGGTAAAGNVMATYSSNSVPSSSDNYRFNVCIGSEFSGDIYQLDGKTYGLMYWEDGTMGKALMASQNATTSNNLDALSLTVMSTVNNGAKLYVPDESDISFWTFHYIEGSADSYYITTVQEGSTKYLKIANNKLTLVSEPDNNCKITVTPGTGTYAGKIYLKCGSQTLYYSGNIDSGFKVGGTTGLQYLNLVEESELTSDYFMTYSADKVSVSDERITDGSKIIVYTRVWNETTLKYEFYAIDQDGSLVRCYESGDSIEWVGGRLNSMLWNFEEHYWEGTNTPNYYYELYNQYSNQFLAPQKSSGQILANSAIGINLNGRKNGQYYTPIVAWDDGYYAYAGLKADVTSGKIVSCELSEADDFYFAIVHDIPADDELTVIDTVDHTQYGITMKMINFGTDMYTGNSGALSGDVMNAMDGFLGQSAKKDLRKTVPGILKSSLGEDGYPVAAATGNSLSAWFADRPEVNHLFIQSTYSATGYFEYDCTQNAAHLDQEKNEFVVYKELCASGSADANTKNRHGQFWPYNDIVAGKFAPTTNTVYQNITDQTGNELPDSDPRKYERLYAIQKSNTTYAPDYYMGMEITASFTQTPDGLDDWGHDIIYEFNGDDDFWLFVDGVLVLDLGGKHDALPGSVNYRTGVINENGTASSLREKFAANYRDEHPGASEADVNAYLDTKFDGEHFKDYTAHTMKIYYLERGAYASNLHLRFNLASIKPGTAQLTKKLSGIETNETILAEFPYQIIYRTKTGDTISKDIYLTNAVAQDPSRTTNYVFYKDSTAACVYQPTYAVAGKTYNDVFFLKPDETVDIDFSKLTFSEGTELYDYKIVECGVNTDVYKAVKANDVTLSGTDVKDDNDAGINNRKDYGIDYATTEARASVVYDNAVNPDAITNLTIQKKLFDVTGETEVTDDDTTFDFRLYLATESGNVDDSPANLHTYHVKDADGNYCCWSVEQQRLVQIGSDKKVFSDLTEAEQASATFHTSMNGAISKIPVGYTIEVRDILAGTKFKVVERPGEIPDGYSFKEYVYSGKTYTNAADGVTGVVNTDAAPHVEIQNFKGFGLRVNKVWTDADFMAERDPVYFGIFYEDNRGALKLADSSLKQMAYGSTTLYWYYDHLPASGVTDFSQYVIYEVALTDPVVDTEGNVTSYTAITRLDDNDSVTLSVSGRQIGDTSSSQFTYSVTYERGRLSNNNNVRVDTVTNSRPGIRLQKMDWGYQSLDDAEKHALAGASFTLSFTEGEGDEAQTRTMGPFTSDENGLITELYLRDNVVYALQETRSPQGYQGIQEPVTIETSTGEDGTAAVELTGPEGCYVQEKAADGTKVITIRNRPYGIQFLKMDKDTNKPLQYVTFNLYREIVVNGVHAWDLNPYPDYASLKTDENGIVPGFNSTLSTLPPGKYQLRETTPENYQKLSGYITFIVSETGVVTLSDNASEALPEEVTMETITQEDGSVLYKFTIVNTKLLYVSVWKTDTEYNAITTGAKFSLYKADDYDDSAGVVKDGATPVVSGTTGADGILALGQLAVGEYRLVETEAPAGYNPVTSAINIYVRNSGVTASQAGNPSLISTYNSANNTDTDHWVKGQKNNPWQVRVWNNPGYELPSTGGIGTGIIYLIGGLLVLISVIFANYRTLRDTVAKMVNLLSKFALYVLNM